MAELHKFPKVNLIEVPDEEKVEWSAGYLTLTCHNCGYEYKVYGVPENDGRQFLLPITNFHHITLECPNCNSCITLRYVKAEGAETTLMNDVEPVSEEKAKLLAEEENESGYDVPFPLSTDSEYRPGELLDYAVDEDIDQIEIDEQHYRDEFKEDSKEE